MIDRWYGRLVDRYVGLVLVMLGVLSYLGEHWAEWRHHRRCTRD